MACWPVVVAVAVKAVISTAVLLGAGCPISYILATSNRYVVLCICSTYPFFTVPIPILGPNQPPLFFFKYRVSQEERAKLRESVPYVELYRYNAKHLYPKLNGFRDNGK